MGDFRPSGDHFQVSTIFGTLPNILGGIGESVTVGLNWYWNPYARLQFNYIHGNIRNHALVAGQSSGRYSIIGVRGMIDF